jgi:hypothetical protein
MLHSSSPVSVSFMLDSLKAADPNVDVSIVGLDVSLFNDFAHCSNCNWTLVLFVETGRSSRHGCADST